MPTAAAAADALSKRRALAHFTRSQSSRFFQLLSAMSWLRYRDRTRVKLPDFTIPCVTEMLTAIITTSIPSSMPHASHAILSTWTSEREARAVRLFLIEGFTAAEVADALGAGISRAAVIGKIRRLGFLKREIRRE